MSWTTWYIYNFSQYLTNEMCTRDDRYTCSEYSVCVPFYHTNNFNFSRYYTKCKWYSASGAVYNPPPAHPGSVLCTNIFVSNREKSFKITYKHFRMCVSEVETYILPTLKMKIILRFFDSIFYEFFSLPFLFFLRPINFVQRIHNELKKQRKWIR